MLHMIQSMAAMNECCVNVVVQEARFSAFDLSFRVLILPSPIIVIQDLYLCCPLFDDIAVLSVGFRSQQKAFSSTTAAAGLGCHFEYFFESFSITPG